MDVDEFKEGQKALWSMGEFSEIAYMIRPASETIMDATAISGGESLLDVACGTGNLAIPAAHRGAIVTGIDITPKLLEQARAEATAAGLDIDFSEGDVEALAFADDSFDKVVSVFGMIFAPQHELAAAEMVRTAKPGGTVAITAWAKDGLNAALFKVIGSYMPPPPEGTPTPMQWGSEQYVTDHFDDSLSWSFVREQAVFTADSLADWIDFNSIKLGPMILAKAILEPQGKWEALREDLIAHCEHFNSATDGSFVGESEYLLAVGQLPNWASPR